MTKTNVDLIIPKWNAPANVQALSTTRAGGYSEAPYAGLNMGFGSGDDPSAVRKNRTSLLREVDAPSEPIWLAQVHGVECVEAKSDAAGIAADASFSRTPNEVCAVMTADCMPVLFCSVDGERVAAAHAGWRGLANGVLETTCERMGGEVDSIMAWLGPCIGQANYEVGEEVRTSFLADDRQASKYFAPTRPGHWCADLPGLAQQRLLKLGVREVSGGHWCTHAEPNRFYSYRRDGITGRMATLIWRTE
jgi:polyphenol oxidase